MKWTREKDYHGYRSYPQDEAAARADGGIVAALFGAVRAAINFVARPTPSPEPLRISHRELSTMAFRNGLARADDCPFPAAPANDPQRRKRDR
jgi:hypothetical protein